MKILILMGLLLFQATQSDDPPPEPPAGTPACNNYHDSGTHNCRCPKAMMAGGTHDGRPERDKGQEWCRSYCLYGKCNCISPVKSK